MKKNLIALKKGIAPELDYSTGVAIETPKPHPLQPKSLTKEQLIKIASILNQAYKDVETELEKAPDSFDYLYESLEEGIGSRISSFITELAYYQDKNNCQPF